ncbi:MAG TPA: aldo/keto reductase [Methylomusa anaerophila]|uniref:General stress protein 69 n=1 Tax=Methylomusa anaerophila TaxID=1930071 RepID=A0A348AP96_9FIRM|nr:aldo/keto reductase [Methylomusa anaerophila]BBB92894.1 general stress protein 69 [Methylomusa anaerophila]HML87270.1 aldo/keto reductase [Methylomusa anaerophila]
MNYCELGCTGLKVSRLCFGALTIGPLQSKLSLSEGAAVIKAALDAGVNFIDTAELYGTYPYIREALARTNQPHVVIASKSYAYTYEGMRESVETACRELNRNFIDIFLLHEQSSRLTLKGHRDALQFLLNAKSAGLVKAVGVSTHAVEVVQAAAAMEQIDVIHPILNMRGIGIADGNVVDMLTAIHAAAAMGKGIYAMKALGGGHLCGSALESFNWVLAQQGVASVAVGMQSREEVLLNTAIFSGKPVSRELSDKVSAKQRHLIVEEGCAGCGTCLQRCPASALYINDEKVNVNAQRCILCGYCGAACPNFCLKII